MSKDEIYNFLLVYPGREYHASPRERPPGRAAQWLKVNHHMKINPAVSAVFVFSNALAHAMRLAEQGKTTGV
jgi:hypothetical protein